MNEITFRAMGTDIHVVVVGPTSLLDAAQRRFDELERRWSRFLPDSEISMLNARAGTAVEVSDDTIALVRLSIEGARITGGLFDPLLLDALVAAGYDRSFDDLPTDGVVRDAAWRPSPASTIAIDRVAGTVTLPRGARFDPGGIGKGFAADLISGQVMDAGARGACVSAGGDVRCMGDAPDSGAWRVAIEHHGRGQVATVGMHDGAVATSSRMRRRWIAGGREHHHLIDPRTGRSADGPVESVSVVAESGWRAEVLAKAAFLSGPQNAASLPGVIDIYASVSPEVLA